MSRLRRDSFWQSELILLIAAVLDLLVFRTFGWNTSRWSGRIGSTTLSARRLCLRPPKGHADSVERPLRTLDYGGTTHPTVNMHFGWLLLFAYNTCSRLGLSW